MSDAVTQAATFAFLGALGGAAIGFLGHFYVQRSTARRERQGELRKAYAAFSAGAYEYLDAWLENETLQRSAVTELYEDPANRDEIVGVTADYSMDLPGSYRALRQLKSELNRERCQVMILERNEVFRARIHHAYNCLVDVSTFRVGDEAEVAFERLSYHEKYNTLVRDVTELTLELAGRHDL